jgi:methylase of polypeptide subunit release factors
MHLMPDAFRDLGDRYWQHLAEFVRTGQSIPQAESVELDESDFHVEDASSQWLMTPAALDVTRLLDIGHSRRGLDILELAAGSAVWSLAMAHSDPECHLTIVDRPDRLAAARSHAAAIGISDRIAIFREGRLVAEVERDQFSQHLIMSYAAGTDETYDETYTGEQDEEQVGESA